jgi:hypothetical protein
MRRGRSGGVPNKSVLRGAKGGQTMNSKMALLDVNRSAILVP